MIRDFHVVCGQVGIRIRPSLSVCGASNEVLTI